MFPAVKAVISVWSLKYKPDSGRNSEPQTRRQVLKVDKMRHFNLVRDIQINPLSNEGCPCIEYVSEN